MVTIGIYDSGIGGLTSMAQIAESFNNINFFYLADNANMPFGIKNHDEIEEIVYNGVKILEANSDVSVLACNTASIVTGINDVFKLLPDLSDLDKETSLVMATPLTLSHLTSGNASFNAADTKDLATLVELRAALAYKSKTGLNTTFSALSNYLKERLQTFYNVKTVVLGCSHYGYIKNEIIKIFGAVKFRDGNRNLIANLSYALPVECLNLSLDGKKTAKPYPKTKFVFTGQDESEKYDYIYNCFLSENKQLY